VEGDEFPKPNGKVTRREWLRVAWTAWLAKQTD